VVDAPPPWLREDPGCLQARSLRQTSRVRAGPSGTDDRVEATKGGSGDRHAADYYASSPTNNPPDPSTGTSYVDCGGWYRSTIDAGADRDRGRRADERLAFRGRQAGSPAPLPGRPGYRDILREEGSCRVAVRCPLTNERPPPLMLTTTA